jgi:three-Cys-motif partner protein
VYIDGFAGPGRYLGNEPGSPLVALEAARAHAERKPDARFEFLFVERDPDRAANLEQEIAQLSLPPNMRPRVIQSEFEATLTKVLDELDRARLPNAPIFALVDPFGIDGFPFDLLARLLGRPRTEILITFMTSYVKRFAEQWPDKLPGLLGSREGTAEVLALRDPAERVDRIRLVYASSLHKVAQFVRYFTMQDRAGRTIYDLFFAGNHPLGHVKMKEAMRAVGRGGEYRFADGIGADQRDLFGDEVPRDLARILGAQFAGHDVESELAKTHMENETGYISKDFTAAMRLLERGGVPGFQVEVAPTLPGGRPRKKGTFPPGTRIRFMRTT